MGLSPSLRCPARQRFCVLNIREQRKYPSCRSPDHYRQVEYAWRATAVRVGFGHVTRTAAPLPLPPEASSQVRSVADVGRAQPGGESWVWLIRCGTSTRSCCRILSLCLRRRLWSKASTMRFQQYWTPSLPFFVTL